MPSTVTTQMIAELAGVSQSTVSKALAGGYSLRPKTRQRILEIARRLNYHPSGAARALVSGRNECIGVSYMHGRVPSDLFNQILEGVHEVFFACGYTTTTLMAEGETAVPRLVRDRLVDGLVIGFERDRELESFAASVGMPCVLVNAPPTEELDCVTTDNVGGVAAAVAHLAELGHRRIAYVSTWSHDPVSRLVCQDRARGYLQAMASQQLPACPVASPGTPVMDSLGSLLALPQRPTALVCFNDEIAMMTIKALFQRSLHVPRDVSVVGIDNLFASEYMIPSLSTLEIPWRQMGVAGAELLWQRLQEPHRPRQHKVLSPRLIIRESVASPPA
ncbi:MAG TPA: LacI family DNA-binding transcriptional regulator [Phycisphaeraceae bacterium]